jgi:stage II sporulation protein D
MAKLAAAFALLFGLQAHAGTPTLRVRVLKSVPSVTVRGVSLQMDSNEYQWATSGITSLKIRWKGGFFRMEQAEAPVTASFEGDILTVRGMFLQMHGKRVSNEMRLVRKGGGLLDVVVVMPIDEYLAGVIPSEMPAIWPAEALKAQAVAARSFALRMAETRRNKPFDVDVTVLDQVHRFEEDMNLKPRLKSKVKRVIAETKGQVLLDTEDKVLKAFYSADCGCASEDPKFVWGGRDDNFPSVTDPTCERRRTSTWNLTIKRPELRKRLLEALNLQGSSSLRALHVGQRSPSGRVSTIVAAVDLGGKSASRTLSAQEFRRLVGFNKVRSTKFSLKWLGDQLYIRGEGIGHGVGLCQTGARTLAQSGANYHDILKLYYPKAKLASL